MRVDLSERRQSRVDVELPEPIRVLQEIEKCDRGRPRLPLIAMDENFGCSDIVADCAECCVDDLRGDIIDVIDVDQVEDQAPVPPRHEIFGVVL